MSARDDRHTYGMQAKRTAHGDVTGLTLIYAFLLGALVAGRWGWGSVAVYTVVAVPLGVWWLDRRMQAYRRLK